MFLESHLALVAEIKDPDTLESSAGDYMLKLRQSLFSLHCSEQRERQPETVNQSG